jgi:cyclic beta-1,2-glucan synthetase
MQDRFDCPVMVGAVSGGRPRAEPDGDGGSRRQVDQAGRWFGPVVCATLRQDEGYPPGIRENGGQYTHAATWSVMAMAKLGEGDKAFELFSMLNPINHARTRSAVHRYKVEPYVLAADIYAKSPHVGRGGWTWYTGSAGWMQRAGLEAILGLRIKGEFLHLDPCIPKHWPSYEMTLVYHSATYRIRIENPRGESVGIHDLVMDGAKYPAHKPLLPLRDDGKVHHVVIVLGKPPAS